MFTYLKLKNFKSLKDVTLNLKETQKKTKNFVAIYGENGCGKTHLVTAFDALRRIIFSKVAYKALQEMPKDFQYMKEFMERSDMYPEIFDLFKGIEGLGMIDETEPTEVEYGFLLDGVEGNYYVKFDDTILEEKLYYKENKKRNFHFEIKKVEEKIDYKLNLKIFKGTKYRKEISEQIEKYWGKHSFLAILYEEFVNKNKTFIEDNVSENLIDVVDKFSKITVKLDKKTNIPYLSNVFNNFRIEEGLIDKSKLILLDKYEKILNSFFTQAYADVKAVYYDKKEKDNQIDYSLYFEKKIANKVRKISYKEESGGTLRILGQFNNLIDAIRGKVVVIDEIDNGIHDLLVKNIIMSMKDEITGQLIITTHNTLLLETLPAKELYLITFDYDRNKEINCITDYDFKIQKNNNVRDLYFKGLFGGIPVGEYIDFDDIKNTLIDETQEEGK